MDQSELLALELIETALDIGDMAHEGRGAVPIGRRRVEDPGEVIAVGRCREAVRHGENRNLVDCRLGDQLQRYSGRIGVDDYRVLALHRLVALDALLGVVAGLALLNDKLGTADTSIALV